jgi:transcription-repair coupling factor (superfamily II helicase)
MRSGDLSIEMQDQWSPQINVGAAVLIPEHYVPDLTVRLALYRRLAELEEPQEIEGFAAELTDRFGPLPEEAEVLLKIVAIKRLCRRANVEKVDAGPKGITVQFRKNEFPNPTGLIKMLSEGQAGLKLKQDQRIVRIGDFETPEARLKGAHKVLDLLARVAEADEKVA